MAGFGEVQHRSYAGGCWCGGCHQDGAGSSAWAVAAHAACGRADAACGLVGGRGQAAGGAGAVARW